MVAVLIGPLEWSMTRDDEGHREYKLVNLVRCTSKYDGPATAMTCPGLPIPGSLWIVDNDIDVWAWCRWNSTVTPRLTKEPNYFFEVEQTFSTKPLDLKYQRCNDTPIEDPLLEPNKISGTFTKKQEEAFKDRWGNPITNSAHEQIRGPQIEFDRNYPTVRIEQNVAQLGIELFGPMVDTVNVAPLWGLPRRCIKLSNVSWERKFYGQCFKYYTRTLEFDVNTETFDKDLLDEGTKVLNGKWGATGEWQLLDINRPNNIPEPPNPRDPTHFIRATDRLGNNTRIILNGFGMPANVVVPLESVSFYVSIDDANLNNDLSDVTSWVPINAYSLEYIISVLEGSGFAEPTNILYFAGGGTGFQEFNSAHAYGEGEIVVMPGTLGVYISLENISPPQGEFQFPGAALSSGVWILITFADIRELTYIGEYDEAHTYTSGDIVKKSADRTRVGSIHVEKYPESNFLLLGIPIIL
jgi:hypothetical protein